MSEIQTRQIPQEELEPRASYATGDIVRLEHPSDPDRIWLLTTPAKEVPGIGLEVGAVELNQEGKLIALDGTILMTNIKEKIGIRKTPDEITKLYLKYFDEEYGENTVPQREVVAMVARTLGLESTED